VTDHYDLAFRPERYRAIIDVVGQEIIAIEDEVSKRLNKIGKETGESSSVGVVVALLFIIVVACAVGIVWKRKQNAKDAEGQKDFDGAIVMQEQGQTDI
jgi:hypothetical protein